MHTHALDHVWYAALEVKRCPRGGNNPSVWNRVKCDSFSSVHVSALNNSLRCKIHSSCTREQSVFGQDFSLMKANECTSRNWSVSLSKYVSQRSRLQLCQTHHLLLPHSSFCLFLLYITQAALVFYSRLKISPGVRFPTSVSPLPPFCALLPALFLSGGRRCSSGWLMYRSLSLSLSPVAHEAWANGFFCLINPKCAFSSFCSLLEPTCIVHAVLKESKKKIYLCWELRGSGSESGTVNGLGTFFK